MFWIGLIIGIAIGTICGIGIIAVVTANDNREKDDLSQIEHIKNLRDKTDRNEFGNG